MIAVYRQSRSIDRARGSERLRKSEKVTGLVIIDTVIIINIKHNYFADTYQILTLYPALLSPSQGLAHLWCAYEMCLWRYQFYHHYLTDEETDSIPALIFQALWHCAVVPKLCSMSSRGSMESSWEQRRKDLVSRPSSCPVLPQSS